MESTGVLIIEDDPSIAGVFERSFKSAGFDVASTHSGARGLSAARRHQFAAIVLDIRLPDIDGLDVLRTLSAEGNRARIVVVSGHLTVRQTVEAIKLGASDVLEKPVSVAQLLESISTTTIQQPGAVIAHADTIADIALKPESQKSHSVAHRWAADVVNGCLARKDSRTLLAWATQVGTSSTMIRERCRMLDVRPHDARDLMRALFAMLRSEQQNCAPHVLLDIADGRTLQIFRKKAGPDFRPTREIEAINRFIDSQRFVDPRNYGVAVLRSMLPKVLPARLLGR